MVQFNDFLITLDGYLSGSWWFPILLVGTGIFFMALTDFGKSSIKLMGESRTELRRVVWPTRVETTQTFLVVFISIVVVGLILWGLESILSWLTKLILG